MRRLATLVLSLALAAVAGAAAPVRVATLLPYVEDALDRCGDSVEVVASVRRRMDQPPPPPIVDLGSPHAPNFEQLAAARPTVIVGDRALHGPQRERLARTGAEVVLVGSESVRATFDGLDDVGRRCGVAHPMAAQVATARAALESLSLAQRTRVLLLFGTPGSFLVVTDRTWLGDLVVRLNFDNVGAAVAGAERHPGFVQVSDEVLAGLRPEVILLVAHGDPEAIRAAFERRLEAGGPWAAMRAAATGGVHVLPSELFATNPGLGLPDAARRLRDLAGPQVSGR